MPDKNKNIKVSACIVTFNNSNSIVSTVSSIINNTKGVELTLYISDNNSSDNTRDIILEKFPTVKIIKNDRNAGFGYGHNKLLELINSDYHFVINPDIILKDDAITKIVDKLENDNSVVMATSKILNEDGTEQHLPKKNPKFRYLIGGRFEKYGKIFKKYRDIYTMRNEIITEPLDIEFCTGCFFCIKTDAFKKLNGFYYIFFIYF